jgi:hypothetical protein
MRVGSRTAKGYRRSAFEDAWARYLPGLQPTPNPSQRNNRSTSNDDTPIASGNNSDTCDAPTSVTSLDFAEPSDTVTPSTLDAWDQQVREIVDFYSGA